MRIRSKLVRVVFVVVFASTASVTLGQGLPVSIVPTGSGLDARFGGWSYGMGNTAISVIEYRGLSDGIFQNWHAIGNTHITYDPIGPSFYFHLGSFRHNIIAECDSGILSIWARGWVNPIDDMYPYASSDPYSSDGEEVAKFVHVLKNYYGMPYEDYPDQVVDFTPPDQSDYIYVRTSSGEVTDDIWVDAATISVTANLGSISTFVGRAEMTYNYSIMVLPQP